MANSLTNRTGWIYIVLIVAVPLLTWLRINGLEQFEGGYGFWHSLGELAGLGALCLYATNFMLSTRLRIFDDLFGGMNRAYIAHHTVGGLALIAMLMHPLLMAAGYVADGMARDGALLLLPTYGEAVNWPVNFGIFALMGTFVILFITFYAKWKHERWLKLHRLIGLAFLLAGTHVFLIPSDVSDNMFLRYYMLGLVALGLVAYCYRVVFGEQLISRKHMVVSRVTQVSKRSVRIGLMPRQPRDALRFAPGQFVFIRFKQPGLPYEFHPFSITTAPGSPEVALIAKGVGDFTGLLGSLRAGTPAEVEGAFGRFSVQAPAGKPQIWVAGGIGITPFLSMAKSLSPRANVDLYYVVDDATDLVEYNELMRAVSNLQGHLRFSIYYSKQQGRISAGYIKQQAPGGVVGKHILLCGPPPMMRSLREQFNHLGVPDGHIHTEEFALS